MRIWSYRLWFWFFCNQRWRQTFLHVLNLKTDCMHLSASSIFQLKALLMWLLKPQRQWHVASPSGWHVHWSQRGTPLDDARRQGHNEVVKILEGAVSGLHTKSSRAGWSGWCLIASTTVQPLHPHVWYMFFGSIEIRSIYFNSSTVTMVQLCQDVWWCDWVGVRQLIAEQTVCYCSVQLFCAWAQPESLWKSSIQSCYWRLIPPVDVSLMAEMRHWLVLDVKIKSEQVRVSFPYSFTGRSFQLKHQQSVKSPGLRHSAGNTAKLEWQGLNRNLTLRIKDSKVRNVAFAKSLAFPCSSCQSFSNLLPSLSALASA